MSWGSATYLRFVDEANESDALNWGEVVGGSADVWEGGVPGGVVDSATVVLVQNEAGSYSTTPHSHVKGRTFGWSEAFPSNQSTTPFRSVTLTSPTVSPLSRACFMYSVTEASLSSHVT